MSAVPAVALNSASISTGTSRKCILQITAPANSDVDVEVSSISFDGQTAGNPKVYVELVNGGTAATGSGSSAVTPAHRDSRLVEDQTIQTTATEGYSSVPTGGSVVAHELVHPQGGYTFREAFTVKRGTTFSIFCTTATSVGARARISFKE